MIYALTFIAGLLGLFGHWLTRYKQSRTYCTFKEYMLGDWVSSVQSVLANISSSMGIAMSMPDDIHGKALVFVIFSAYTAGYMFDSTLNREKKPEDDKKEPIKEAIKNDNRKHIDDVLADDSSL